MEHHRRNCEGPCLIRPTRPPKLSLRRKYRQSSERPVSLSAAAVLVLVPLLAIFIYLLIKGIGSVNLAFLTQTPKPVGEPGGGMANAIVGSGSSGRWPA